MDEKKMTAKEASINLVKAARDFDRAVIGPSVAKSYGYVKAVSRWAWGKIWGKGGERG